MSAPQNAAREAALRDILSAAITLPCPSESIGVTVVAIARMVTIACTNDKGKPDAGLITKTVESVHAALDTAIGSMLKEETGK